MARKFALALFLALAGLLVYAETTSRCRGSGCCAPCSSCWTPCCSCWCTGVNPCTSGPGPHPMSVKCWCPCCPTHLPCWSWCYVPRYHGWYCVKVFAYLPSDKAKGNNKNKNSKNQVKKVIPSRSSKATIVVTIPADAKLTIHDHLTASTSGKRTFVTPALKPGQLYYYTFKATLSRNNKVETITRRVKLQAGKEVRINLKLPPTTVAVAK